MHKSMLLTTSSWDNGAFETFKMIPITKECPYSEAFFDPTSKILVIIGNNPQEQFTLLPKLSEFGTHLVKNGKALMERQRIHGFKEYYISKTEEIVEFVNLFALNAYSFQFNKYLQGELIVLQQEATQAEATERATADLS